MRQVWNTSALWPFYTEDEAPTVSYITDKGMSFFRQPERGLFMSISLKIRVVPGFYAVSRLDAAAAIPEWLQGPGFKAAVHSDDEVTVVCLEERVPRETKTEKGWACLRTIGPFPFEAAGIVKSVIDPLSNNGIGVFVLCTYDGEHVLVPSSQIELALLHLEAAGHVVSTN